LYNTTFWALVLKGGRSATEAEEDLKGTVSADKNEILFSKFGINYNNEPEMYRKGSIMLRKVSAVLCRESDPGADAKSSAMLLLRPSQQARRESCPRPRRRSRRSCGPKLRLPLSMWT
jgi:tRNA(His) guanylyltransferase